ncbi:hypothetical protein ZTR_00362 [Talaromyces verruculosus]|nr:hypothetical protein ZTR_00362 [Talaromyces verruculosus]
MAHGGKWTLEQRIYLVAMKLAATYGWEKVAEDFRAIYGSGATKKDVESKYNKDLKGGPIFRVLTELLTAGILPEDPEEQRILACAVLMIGEIPMEYRRA